MTSPAAIEKLDWYAQRWKIETFHKVLKSGCQAEQSKLRTAERLTNLLAVLCIVGWRVFWLTMVNRTNPRTAATRSLPTPKSQFSITSREIPGSRRGPRLPIILNIVAKLGGYLARKADGPPGNLVLWRGLSRLTDIHLGVEIGEQLVGN